MNKLTEQPMKAHHINDLLCVVPSMLGYHPSDSLVAVLVQNGKVKVTGRVDIKEASSVEATQFMFGALLDRHPDAVWLAVAYTDDEERGWKALDTVDSMIDGAAPLQRIVVGSGVWRLGPLDAGKRYDPSVSPLAAEAAFRGISVLPSRQALADTLSPSLSPAQMNHALDLVLAREPKDVVNEAMDLLQQLMRERRDVTAREGACLAVAAHCPDFADAVVSAVDASTAEQAFCLWTSVVRATSPRVGAGAAVLLGVASWVKGEGTIQSICMERAEPYAHDFRWYQFLVSVNRSATPPQEWQTVRGDMLAA